MVQDAGLDTDFDAQPPVSTTAGRKHARNGKADTTRIPELEAGPGITPGTDRELARIQGAAAKVVPGTTETVTPISNGNGKAKPAQVVEFMGRQFRVADKIGLMPLLKFSAFADVSTSDPRALGAMYAMLRDCIHPGSPGCGKCEVCDPEPCGECTGCEQREDGDDSMRCYRNTPNERACPQFDAGDWLAFEDHAMATRADADDLFDVISEVMELISGRPTKPPGSSSPGQRRTSGGSTGSSSARRGKASRR
jgi:hypothetical protein